MMSVADTCIIPMQDILSLGSDARMNNPSKPIGNWEWKLTEGITTNVLAMLGELTSESSRP